MFCLTFRSRRSIVTHLKRQYYIERIEDENRRTFFLIKRTRFHNIVGREDGYQNIEAAEDHISDLVKKRLKILIAKRKRRRTLLDNIIKSKKNEKV